MAIRSMSGWSNPVVRTETFVRAVILPALKSRMIAARSPLLVLPVRQAEATPQAYRVSATA
jgi:hypothetical protein